MSANRHIESESALKLHRGFRRIVSWRRRSFTSKPRCSCLNRPSGRLYTLLASCFLRVWTPGTPDGPDLRFLYTCAPRVMEAPGASESFKKIKSFKCRESIPSGLWSASSFKAGRDVKAAAARHSSSMAAESLRVVSQGPPRAM